MYFDFEDQRPDTPTIAARAARLARACCCRSIIHLVAVILILIGPHLPFMQGDGGATASRRSKPSVRRSSSGSARTRQFVFVQPRVDMPAPKPPPRAELSDIDRRARTVERAPKPTNPLPFSRGNTTERIEAGARRASRRRRTAPPQPEPAQPEPDAPRPFTLPEAPNAHADAAESAQQPQRSSRRRA